MKEFKMKNQARHGDILIQKIEVLPEGATQKEEKKIVLAEGTSTGHKHLLSGDVKSYEKDGKTFFAVGKKAKLTHEEHATIVFSKGIYQVHRQVEYGADKAAKQVED
jgi:hypothetical protein